ncbi:MAG: glutaredoxin family protein [Candidatus Pacebacteria bacterium]|nr:glutaredoxin family protein [Candidatus Paceibacterota bacterium]
MEGSNKKEVVIYSTPTCHFCQQAKEFFKENNVEYIEHDVAADQEKAQEMVTRSGQMGVPVIFIGDEMTIGFDEGKLRTQLGL